MELVDRYLNAVKFWLPWRQREDITAELSEDLRSEIEERESACGRKLTEAETAQIVKAHGHPVLVASRYLPREHLIGPALYPVYRLVIAGIVYCYLAPWLLIWFGLMLFSPDFRASHGVDWLPAIASMLASLWTTSVALIGTATFVMAVLDRLQTKWGLLDRWEPGEFIGHHPPNRISRTGSSIEIVISLVVLAWLLAGLTAPSLEFIPGARVDLTPLWPYLFSTLLALTLVNAALAAVNLMRPYWTPARAAARLFLDSAFVAVWCWLLKSGIVAGIAAAWSAEIAEAINTWTENAVPVSIAVGVVLALVDGYRLIRLSRTAASPILSVSVW